MGRTLLITGGYGFIGRYVARHFAKHGWQVIGVGHGGWEKQEWEAWGFTAWHAGDVTLETMRAHGGQPDSIIHCVGGKSVGFSLDQPYADFQSNVTTTLSLLEFVRLYIPTSRVVYLSSAAVYGNASHLPIVESVPLYPVSPYGLHKKMAEEICRSYSRHFGVATAIVRLFSVYGPGLRKQLLWDACVKMARQEVTFSGGGQETRDWLHVQDAVALLAKARDHASTDSPTVNGGTGIGVTVRAIVSEVCNVWRINRAPEFSALVRRGDPAHYVADTTLASKWGWQPKTDWRDGLREYVEWFRKGAL